MKDLLMSCKVECPPVSRDLLNGWVNRSSERNQQGNWSSVLEPNCSRGYVCVWAECWIMTRTQMKQWQWRPHLPFCSCREQGCVAQAEALAPPGISICSDSTGLQPRCGNKTIFPGEIQTVYFLCFGGAGTETVKIMTQKMYWDLFLACRSTELNLQGSVGLDHAIPWDIRRYLGVERVGILTKNNDSPYRTVHCFWGTQKYYPGLWPTTTEFLQPQLLKRWFLHCYSTWT